MAGRTGTASKSARIPRLVPVALIALIILAAAEARAQRIVRPATAVVDIAAEDTGHGTVVVAITASPSLPLEGLRHFRIPGDSPRLVIVLSSIDEPYLQTTIPVGAAGLRRIRVGHHGELSPPELHVVMDLTSSAVELTGLALAGNTLRVTLTGPPGEATAPTPPESDPELVEERTPASPEPFQERAAASPEADPPAADADPPSIDPARGALREATPEATETATSRPLITAISIEPREDRSTMVTIEASAPLPEHSVRELLLAGDPPRQVLRFEGVEGAETLAANLPVGSVTLNAVRTIHDPVRRPGQLWIVLELADVDVEAAALTLHGNSVQVLLRPGP